MPLDTDLTQQVTNTLDAVSSVTGAKHVNKLADKATGYLADHASQLLSGTVILVIGIVVTGWIARGVAHILEKRKLEPPERLLILAAVRLLLFSLTVAVSLDICGYPLSAIVAGLSVLAVGVGFAMQGLLGNIIAGLTLIFTKPFRVGEYIEVLGAQGLVVHVDIISTTLRQMDHSKLVIPNHKIVGEVLHNYGMTRQLNLNFGVGFQTDLTRVRALIEQALADNTLALNHPAPLVMVGGLRDSAIAITVKIWVTVADIEFAEGELYETIIDCLRGNQIELPFPRRDIRILNPNPSPP